MLKGEYRTIAERPYIQGWIHIPRLSVQGTIWFLADTGADCTTLMPVDGLPIEISYDQLEESSKHATSGIGGSSDSFLEQAYVIFADVEENVAYGYEIGLAIIPPEDWNQNTPSLLGRDIMKRWRIVFDQSENELLVNVRSCDRELSLD